MFRNLFTFSNKKMNVIEFIDYVNTHKEEFTCYCEILIDKLGFIYLARPNHQNAIIAIAAKQNNQTFEEYHKEIPKECSPLHWTVSKDNIIAIWYDIAITPLKLNRFQERTLRILHRNGIIAKYVKHIQTSEYQRYLQRLELVKNSNKEILFERATRNGMVMILEK
jgi:glycogen debranching enzyme